MRTIFSFVSFLVISRSENLLNWDVSYTARLKDIFIMKEVCYVVCHWRFKCVRRYAYAIACFICQRLDLLKCAFLNKCFNYHHQWFCNCLFILAIFVTILVKVEICNYVIITHHSIANVKYFNCHLLFHYIVFFSESNDIKMQNHQGIRWFT